ncbi:Hypothetical predicted protein, partial [Pelobates cultripes]
PRLSHRTLQQSTARGGVGLPDVHAYYKAAILEAAVKLHTHKGVYQWVDMEVAHAGKTPLVDLLWTPATYRPKDKSLLPTTKLTIYHWDKLRQKHYDTHKFHPRTPLTALKAISPWLSLHSWVKLGITHIEQVLQGGLIKPFPDLQEEFKLTNSSVFPYLQLKSVLPTHVTQSPPSIDPDLKDITSLYD